MQEQDADVAGKFWDLANYLAGFAAAQIITFLLAIAPQQDVQKWIVRKWGVVIGIMVGFNLVIYVAGVWSCFCAERKLRPRTLHGHLRLAAIYRTVWILAFTALGVGAVVYLIGS